MTHKTSHVVCNLAKWKSITPTFCLIFIFLLSLSFFLSKELFRRKRWRLVSVQLSNKFGYSPWCTVYFVLVLHNHNSLSLGRNDPSFPVSCCTFQSIYLSNALYFSSPTESFLSIHVYFPSAVPISTQSIYLLIYLSNALSFSSSTESFLSIHISFPSAVPISTQSIYLLIFLSNALSFSSLTESFLSICVVSVSFYFGRANIRNESKQKSAKNLTGNFFAFHI